MPAEDVSDLRDVVDAINRLCETMKTSGYEETEYEDCTDVTWSEEVVAAAVESGAVPAAEELVGPEQVCVREVERWSEPACDLSEAYYSASEVSLAEAEAEAGPGGVAAGPGGVAAGHVAAMRERFESMTRANTPCPDLGGRVTPSPAPDLGRSVTPSPAPALGRSVTPSPAHD